MRIIIAATLLFYLAGCSSLPGMPGHISSSKSTFDGSTNLSMQPALIYRENDGFSGSDLRLALYWSTAFENGELLLRAEVDGYDSFVRNRSLVFNIDGEMHHPESLDQTTNFEFNEGEFMAGFSGTSSSKSYVVTEDFVNQLLNAERAAVRAILSDGYVEGVFTDDTPNSAYLAFQEFMERRSKIQ